MFLLSALLLAGDALVNAQPRQQICCTKRSMDGMSPRCSEPSAAGKCRAIYRPVLPHSARREGAGGHRHAILSYAAVGGSSVCVDTGRPRARMAEAITEIARINPMMPSDNSIETLVSTPVTALTADW